MLNESQSVLDYGGERATLAIGSFRLDVDTATLYRGNDPLPVGRRAVALLSALAKRQGLVVSKDELILAAWSGLVVEESNLSVQIAALRKALAAEPGGERWIETLPRRGYRFVGPTTASSHHSAIDEETVPPTQGARLAVLSAGATSGRSQEGSIARRSRWLVGRNGPLATLDKVTQRMLAGDRHGDVALGGERRQQVEALKHESDFVAAQPGALRVRHGGQLVAVHQHRAFGGLCHAADHVQQRGFAAAGRPHHRHGFSWRHLEIHSAQRGNFHFARVVELPQIFRFEYRFQALLQLLALCRLCIVAAIVTVPSRPVASWCLTTSG